jgi:tetratricopeptide (TPR) repeat protein
MGQASSLDQQGMNNYESAVFVSYAWGGESEQIVNALERAFLEQGMSIVRDKKDLAYKGSIKEFERRIGQGQCIVLVISDKYLKSEHCMYELLQVDNNKSFRDRVFPIAISDAHIYNIIERLEYVKYWEGKIKDLNNAIRNVELTNISGFTSVLDQYWRIRASFDHLSSLLSDMNVLSPELHESQGFSSLIRSVKERMNSQRANTLEKDMEFRKSDLRNEKLVEITLEGNINEIDFELVCYILSRKLHIDQQSIRIVKIEIGSVKIRLRLPEKAALELFDLYSKKDPGFYHHLTVIEVRFVEDGVGIDNKEESQPSNLTVDRDAEEEVPALPNRKAEQLRSSSGFVGRENELTLFQQMIEEPYGDKRILLLLGSGGIGKTKLVREMLGMKQEAGILIARDPIDLFSTDYRHIDGIQWKIKDIIEELTELNEDSSPFANWVAGKTDTSENFYECLKTFCAKQPLVLAFDTFESLDRVASAWLFKGEPDGLQVPGLICIVAGRKEEIDDLDVYIQINYVKATFMMGLTLDESEEFYQRIRNEFVDLLGASFNRAGLAGVSSTKQDFEWIWQLTGGHPLRLEMIFQWLGTLLEDESLKDLSVEKFEEQLMMQVRELAERGQLDAGSGKQVSQQVYDTLLCMAYVTRRFDEDFLQHLRAQKIIRLEDTNVTNRDIISNLEQYFFVKVRQANSEHNFLQLHDEMARMVREYVWPFHDPSGQKKRILLDAVVNYYIQLIADSDGEDTDALRIERLYYVFQQDWKEGLRQWFKLAEEGNENINKLLPGEIKKYLSSNYYDDAKLVQVHSKIADMERNAGHIRQAVGHWERVKELGEKSQREDWVVDALVGLFNCRWMTEPGQALEQYLQPAQAICEKSFPERLALIYYETGSAYRQMQDFEQAVEWYEKGVQTLQRFREDDILESLLRNDVGYTYLILGRWGDAAKNLTAALEIREALWHQAERRSKAASDENKTQLLAERNKARLFVGLSRNTLGEYHRYVKELEEALKDYEQAYGHFDVINDYYWQAKCLGARGETYRRLAWQAWEKKREDTVIQEYLDKARQDVDQSLYLCEKYQLDDERDTAYRRLGRIAHDLGLMEYRQGNAKQAQERLEEAYAYFKRGLGYAEKSVDTLEELENLTELAFLADDSVVFYGLDAVPDYYYRAVDELEDGLKKHGEAPQRLYLYPVFEALWKMEKAAIALAERDYETALQEYIEAFKGLGIFPGYGHARYRQHFGHLTQQIESLPREEQVRWCRKFIDVWKNTKMPGRRDKTLADDLLPDLVKWCNRLLQTIV